jgi:predicted RNase H-like HicB family nuclease
MRNRYTAVVQRDGKWYLAFCPEVPEANGQGKTRPEVSGEPVGGN